LGDISVQKAGIQNSFSKNILLIQHVIMLTQFNITCGTAIAINFKKANFEICLNEF
jgi:hypothetical protein